MFYDHIAQFYKDQFVLKKGERAKLVRDFETDEKGRQVYDIKPGDKFIADVKCGCFIWSYLVMTTKETFEVYPGQDFYGMIILEDHHTQGVTPYVLYACGDKIVIWDDDDEPFIMLGDGAALIDDASTCSNYDTHRRLKDTDAYQYWYKAFGVNYYNSFAKQGLSVDEIYHLREADPKLRRWREAVNADRPPKRRGRKTPPEKKILPDSNSYLELIRSKFRDIEYDEETKSLCF